MPSASELGSVAGRDATLPAGQPSRDDTSSSQRYDSLVIHGTGVCALTMAGRAARAPGLSDRVDIVGKPVEESRRLIGGVTMRARTVDYCAEAMGCDRHRFLTEMLGPEWSQAETHRQYAGLCAGSLRDGLRLVRRAKFMDSADRRRNRAERLPLAYGVRNSRFVATLQRLALEAGARLTSEPASSRDDLLRVACGEHPLVVNGTPRLLTDTAITVAPPAPKQFVGAAQMTLRASRLERRGVIERQSSFVCWVPRDGGIDMGVYYPFQDELTPSADYYGIFYRVVDAQEAKNRRAELEQCLADTVVGVGDLLGLEPVDRDDTLGAAVVPVSRWRGVVNSQNGVLDLSRLAGAGSPIISGDGMTRSAIAGLVAAESVIRGREPQAEIDRALRRYRQLNLELHLALSALSRVAVPLMRLHPNLVLFRQTRSYYRDMWAGVASAV